MFSLPRVVILFTAGSFEGTFGRQRTTSTRWSALFVKILVAGRRSTFPKSASRHTRKQVDSSIPGFISNQEWFRWRRGACARFHRRYHHAYDSRQLWQKWCTLNSWWGERGRRRFSHRPCREYWRAVNIFSATPNRLVCALSNEESS